MLKVLQVCQKVPWPPNDGGSLAIYNAALGLMDAGVELSIIAVNALRDKVNTHTIPAWFRQSTKLLAVDIDTRIKPVAAILNLFRRDSYIIQRFYSRSFENELIGLITKESFDIIQIEHLQMCVYVDVIRKYSSAKIVFRPQNVEHKVWQKYLRNLKNPLKKFFLGVAVRRLLRFEKSILTKVDGIIAISADDAHDFRSYHPEIQVIDVPVAFVFKNQDGYDFEKQYLDFPSIYHLGSMDWRPNQEAITWFVEGILPSVRQEFPDLKIYLAGKKMLPEFLKLKIKNLFVEGTVPDALKWQEDKAILIVPLISGGGIRAKIIEAMALGKTIISTTAGASGIHFSPGKEILIADTAEAFVHQISKCISSETLCREMGQAARKRALSDYHYLNCAQAMIAFYHRLAC
jgi:glycosyltransferase involved in cell wall biosynthesis